MKKETVYFKGSQNRFQLILELILCSLVWGSVYLSKYLQITLMTLIFSEVWFHDQKGLQYFVVPSFIRLQYKLKLYTFMLRIYLFINWWTSFFIPVPVYWLSKNTNNHVNKYLSIVVGHEGHYYSYYIGRLAGVTITSHHNRLI